MSRFFSSNRQQAYLLPPSVEDWLPKEHLARFIVQIVDSLDLSAIVKHYSPNRATNAYHPKILLSLLFYGYATGVFSSRKLENATYDSVAFRYIAANSHPDHDTIAHFRQRFLQELEILFIQILLIAKESGLLKVGTVSLDGTKIKANASKHKALSYAHAQKIEAQLKKEVITLMQRASEADNSSDHDGMNIPEEIARREDRIQLIEEAKARIEKREKERHAHEQSEYEEKLKRREEKSKKSGKKPRGRTPQKPSKEINPKAQVNLTDEESRIMKTSGGGFEQCYNAQASVEQESYLITHHHVTQHTNDKQEIEPSLQYFQQHPEITPNKIVADAGYYSENNITLCNEHKIVPYISLNKEKHNQSLDERFKKEEPLPDNPTTAEIMYHRLHTDEGKQIYAKRKSTIETVFGIMKHVMGFRQFFLRGFQSAKGEWNLLCIAYNLKRMHRLQCN